MWGLRSLEVVLARVRVMDLLEVEAYIVQAVDILRAASKREHVKRRMLEFAQGKRMGKQDARLNALRSITQHIPHPPKLIPQQPYSLPLALPSLRIPYIASVGA